MTTSTSSDAASPEKRGRGPNGAFGRGLTAPAAGQSVSSDLAALLDNEVAAIATAVPPPAASRSTSGQPARHSGEAPASPAAEIIDVPPRAAEAAPVAAAQPPAVTAAAATVPGGASSPAGELPLPVPAAAAALAGQERALPGRRRIGAIMVETTTPHRPRPASRDIPDDFGPADPVQIPPMPSPRQLTPEQRQAILANIDPEWLKALHKEVDELYQLVTGKFASPPANAEQMLKMLKEARQILIETPEEYVSAEYRTREVRAMIERTRECRVAGNYYGLRILAYSLGWAVLLLAGLAFSGPLLNWFKDLAHLTGTVGTQVFPFWLTMMWGGIGGVAGALYMLWWHVGKLQDFDRQYTLWYLMQPLMGIILGGIVFLLVIGGFLVLQVDLTEPTAGTAAHYLPYLIALLGGFRQNFVYEQFDRLMGIITPVGSDKNNAEKKANS